MDFKVKKTVMNKQEVSRTIKRMAYEIVEKSFGIKDLVIVGIQTRGVHLAKRIAGEISKIEDCTIPVGSLDITLYRDDVNLIANQPIVKETHIPVTVDDKRVVLVDDVLFTGRTIRCALDELIDFGRPKLVRLAVLIDRGNRELPIQPDFVGKVFKTSLQELICVEIEEQDGRDQVLLKEIVPGKK